MSHWLSLSKKCTVTIYTSSDYNGSGSEYLVNIIKLVKQSGKLNNFQSKNSLFSVYPILESKKLGTLYFKTAICNLMFNK